MVQQLALILALTTHSAGAVQPTAQISVGPDRGAAPSPGLVRVLRYDPGRQGQLWRQPAWRRFQGELGLGWSARFDQRTGLPYRAWGRGIPLGIGPSSGLTEVVRLSRAVLERFPGLTGVDSGDLVFGRGGYQQRTGTWFLRLDQQHDGVPVYRAGVELRVRDRALVMFGVKTYPDIPALEAPQLSPETAIEIAAGGGPAAGVPHDPGEIRLVVLPMEEGSGLTYALAWEVHTTTHSPYGRWVAWVDAIHGDLLAARSELLTLDGTVQGVHDRRTIDGDTVTSGMPLVMVYSAEGGRTYADDEGGFELEGDSFLSRLDGDYVQVQNEGGADGELTFTGADGLWTSASADISEIDSYVFLHHVRDWALRFQPGNGMATNRVTSHVNVADAVCNAWFDGDVNFGPTSGHCNSTARIADVNYHEWGHGFHYWALQAGVFDETASEAIADSISMFLTGDPVIAPYFWVGYSQGIRDLSEEHVYPDDIVYESHEDSLILSGAIWDFLQLMEAEEGEEAGWENTCQIFADAVPSGFTINEAFDEFVLADDDDADLSNGSPHYCQLLAAFVPHGIGPGGSTSLLGLAHAPLDNQPPGAAGYDLTITASDVTAGCFDVAFTGGRAFWSTDGGQSWEYVGLTAADGQLTGTLPAVPDASVVHYYLEAETDDSGAAGLPAGEAINPFSFAVGALEPLYFEDFEASDGGYSHALLEGTEAEGADDWMWGTPTGAAQDPDYAYSGDKVWGNDLGGGNYNGEYQNEKLNQLESAPIEVAPYNDLLVQFRRWLRVEDGYYDHANVLVDGEVAWTNHATRESVGDEHHLDEQWALASILTEDADLDGTITLAWQIDSDQGLAFGGWNIDDVSVWAPPTPRNLMVIRDFSASDGEEPGLVVSWTNPEYEQLAELQVVVRSDGWPTGPEDDAGVVVLHLDTPTPGERVEESLPDAPSGTNYYAVFAADAEGVWTRGGYGGFNADSGTLGVDGGAQDDTGGVGPTPRECGCASGRRAGSGWLWLGGAGAPPGAAEGRAGIR
ncbi:MAG: hypothetical protein ABIO70_25400 [Pseudomonadota bacterium]